MTCRKIISLVLAISLSIVITSCSSIGSNKTDSDKNNIRINEEESKDSSLNEAISTKQKYLKRLNDIQDNLEDLDYLYKGSISDMTKAAKEEDKRWNEALDDINKEVKRNLSKEDRKILKEEQAKWIKYKKDKAAKAASEFRGSTAEYYVYNYVKAKATRDRCYELVNKYMK